MFSSRSFRLRRLVRPARAGALLCLAALPVACSSSSSSAPAAGPQLAIVTASGAPLHAVGGDAIALRVVEVMPDGSQKALASGAVVTWTAPLVVSALSPDDDTDPSPFPLFGGDPTVTWLDNPGRPDRDADLANVLFVLDAGTNQNGSAQIAATVTGTGSSSLDGNVTASMLVDPAPAGDWNRGATLYGNGGAACSSCHGATGHGSPDAPAAATYTIDGATYPFPAPGLNAEPGNAAGDPAWNAALFAVAARADLDNGGITLRAPMPDWLRQPNPATGQPLTTQDLADIFSFLKTQTQ